MVFFRFPFKEEVYVSFGASVFPFKEEVYVSFGASLFPFKEEVYVSFGASWFPFKEEVYVSFGAFWFPFKQKRSMSGRGLPKGWCFLSKGGFPVYRRGLHKASARCHRRGLRLRDVWLLS